VVAFAYALTAYFAQPQQNMRIDLLQYEINGVATNLTNETNARIAKDMILMYNVSQLSMNIDYLYTVLNMTNNSGVLVIENLIYLNASVANLTADVNTIFGILNVTNSSINTLITDVSYLNQTVSLLLNNVSALEAKTLLAGTGITILDQNSGSYGTIYLSNISGVSGIHPYPSSITVDGQGRITTIVDGVQPLTNVQIGPGLTVDSMNPTISGGSLNVTNNYLQLQVITPPATHTHATVTVDAYGRVTMLSSGTHPVTSVAAGIGMSFPTIDSMNPTGSINLSNISGVIGFWTNPNMLVDGQGRINAISNGTSLSVAAGIGMSFTTIDSANPSGTINLSNISGVIGYWSNPNMFVDGQGRINLISNGTSSSGVTSITAGTGLSGGTITTTGTISMPNVGTAGTYTNPTSVTTDAQGRVSSISSFVPAYCGLTLPLPGSFAVVDAGIIPLDTTLGSCTSGYFFSSGVFQFVYPGKHLVQATFGVVRGLGTQVARIGVQYNPTIFSPTAPRPACAVAPVSDLTTCDMNFVIDATAGLQMWFTGLDIGTTVGPVTPGDYSQVYVIVTRLNI
jgi:hypothetical protein